MKKTLCLAGIVAAMAAAWLMAQQPASGDPIIEGFRNVEVASVADAYEQLYGQRAHMSHDMRPLFMSKFAGTAVTVMLKREEHKEGSAASQGMLDAIDAHGPGSVYVMVVEKGDDLRASAA
jgi:4-hydroxy-4-methyl-2-oxoglutarate aldolase